MGNWKCRLFGHRDIDPEAIYDPFICKWCGVCEYDEDCFQPWHIEVYHLTRFRLKNWLKSWKLWFQRCPDCKRRIGRCDQNIDHIPF
jgi:hypothetical protein